MRKKRTTEKGVRMLLTGRAGFTLVELLMALLISSFVGVAIFLAYRTQYIILTIEILECYS